MSKYRPLSDRLRGHPADEWRTNFTDLEAMLGFPLPKGARSGRAWWDRAAPPGWGVDTFDQGQGVVTFRRSEVSPATIEAAAGLAPVGDLSGEAPPEVPRVSPPAASQPAAMREASEAASRKMHANRIVGVAAMAAGVMVAGFVGLMTARWLRERN